MAEKRSISKKHLPKGVDILHEDRDVVVVNKHPGVLTISTDDGDEDNAYDAITHWVRKGNYKSQNRIFIVHRLDRETSGVLVFAKTEKAKRQLQDNWEAVEKIYLAITEGPAPEQREGTFSSYLAENTVFRVYAVLDKEKGKFAETRYKVVKQMAGPRTLWELNLLTGRKHQIRVHLADAGHPIVGDEKYGTGRARGGRMGLHALSLSFNHPHTGERLTFKADPPPWFMGIEPKEKTAAQIAKAEREGRGGSQERGGAPERGTNANHRDTGAQREGGEADGEDIGPFPPRRRRSPRDQ